MNDADFITIICPDCGQETSEQLGRLKMNVPLDCAGCGARLENDPVELVRVAKDNGLDLIPQMRMRRVDPD